MKNKSLSEDHQNSFPFTFFHLNPKEIMITLFLKARQIKGAERVIAILNIPMGTPLEGFTVKERGKGWDTYPKRMEP